MRAIVIVTAKTAAIVAISLNKRIVTRMMTKITEIVVARITRITAVLTMQVAAGTVVLIELQQQIHYKTD